MKKWNRLLALFLALMMLGSSGASQGVAEAMQYRLSSDALLPETVTEQHTPGETEKPLQTDPPETKTPENPTQFTEAVSPQTDPSQTDPPQTQPDTSGPSSQPPETSEPAAPPESSEPAEPPKTEPAEDPSQPAGDEVDGTEESSEPEDESTEPSSEPDAESVLSVQMVPDTEAKTITLSAVLSGSLEDRSAQGSIRLDPHEAAALQDGHGLAAADTEDGGKVLSFSLDASRESLQTVLHFSFEGQECQVEIIPDDLKAVILPEGTVLFDGVRTVFKQQFDWTLNLQADQQMLWKGGQAENLVYIIRSVPAENQDTATLDQVLDIRLEIPEPFRFREGSVSFSEETRTVLADGEPILTLEGLPEDAVFGDLVREQSLLSFRITRAQAEQPLGEMTLKLTVLGSGLEMMPEFMQMRTFRAAPVTEPMDTGLSIQLNASLQSTPVWGSQYAVSKTGVSATAIKTMDSFRAVRKEKLPAKEFIWVDNLNESSLRPGQAAMLPDLMFSLKQEGGSDWTAFEKLTTENMVRLGMQGELPGSFTQVNEDRWTYNAGSLPAEVEKTDMYQQKTNYLVQWKLQPKQAAGYDFKDITQDQIDSGEIRSVREPGWYYLIKKDLTFHLIVRSGDYVPKGIGELVKNNFRLQVNYSGGETHYDLNKLSGQKAAFVFSEDGGTGTLTVTDSWKYNLDGSLIAYHIDQIPDSTGSPSGSLSTPPEMNLEGDSFAIIYDNAKAPNYGTNVDALYSQGTMALTLKGNVNFTAQKQWLDDCTDKTRAKRPGGSFQLWRYRLQKDFNSAAPVRRVNGDIYELELDTKNDQQNIIFTENQDGTGAQVVFPKYDTEGYRYIYAVREYLNPKKGSANYEKLYVDKDLSGYDLTADQQRIADQIQQDRAKPGNAFIYNQGTIQNRISDTVTTRVTKTWDAAAFQAGFSNVRVELQLMYRVQSEQEEEWQKADGKILKMDGFEPENLTKSGSAQMPLYDEQGRTLEYTWVESGVFQGRGSEQNLLEDGKYFTLTQDNRQVRFESVTEKLEDGEILITNTFALHTKYEVDKIWLDAQGEVTEPDRNARVSFGIYRSVSGNPIGETPVGTFEMDGKPDDEPVLINEELEIYAQETDPWHCTIKPLDEFTKGGQQYEYYALENQNEFGSYLYSETEKKIDGYYTRIYNGPGPGNLIHVKKNWVDDSDTLHRHPVTIQVYNKQTNEPVKNASTVLGGTISDQNDSENPWYDEIGIGELTADQVYILETRVGETPVPLNSSGGQEPVDPLGEGAVNAIRFETEEHLYEASYGHERAGDIDFFTVTNRRIGSVDLKVRKNWIDGAGRERAAIREMLKDLDIVPVVRLTFQGSVPAYYEIGRSTAGQPDYVDVGNGRVPILNQQGEPVSSDQILDLSPEAENLYYFGNLPKYDKTGAIVHYTATEVWINEQGQHLTLAQVAQAYPELNELTKEYHLSIRQDSYEIGALHSGDLQQMTITNRIAGVKNVRWHKQWKDIQNYVTGQRPDIYLDIYQQRHVMEDGELKLKTQIYRKDYRWSYEQGDNTYRQTHWHADILNLPKYDDLGYEIIYYAQERTHVQFQDFDYLITRYAYPVGGDEESPVIIGSAKEMASENLDQYGSYAITAGSDPAADYALRESGTFINQISNTVSIIGQKLWKNLPLGYSAQDLPDITIDVIQIGRRYFPLNGAKGRSGPEEKVVATLVIDNWAGILEKGQYHFDISYEGRNKNHKDPATGQIVCTSLDGRGKLPKYDSEGRLYEYRVEEHIQWPTLASERKHQDVYMEPEVNTFMIANVYDSVKGSLAVKKFLEIPVDADGNPVYPGVKFELLRQYRDNQGAMTDPERVEVKIWSAQEVRQAAQAAQDSLIQKVLVFENLELYAPNGMPYEYSVREIKEGFLMDFATNAGSGDLSAVQIRRDEYENREMVSNLQLTKNQQEGRGEPAEEIAVAATFYNRMEEERERVLLKGQKLWTDFQNTFALRPDGEISLTVTRTAPAQPGQGNGITQQLQEDRDYIVLWDIPQQADNAGSWKYYIAAPGSSMSQKVGLDRYAPNGMRWKYQVIEEDVEHYSCKDPDVSEIGVSGKFQDLKNTLSTDLPFQKRWVDQDGRAVQKDYFEGAELIAEFKLQVNDGSGWEDADAYFRENLKPNDVKNVFGTAVITEQMFRKTLSGPIDAAIWRGDEYFRNLPKVIRTNRSQIKELSYRAVETKAGFVQGQKFTFTAGTGDSYRYTVEPDSGMIDAYYPGNRPYVSSRSQMKNLLKTVDLTIRKQFLGDNHNYFSTRPTSNRSGYQWEVSLTLERSADGGGTWEMVTQKGKPIILHIYGKNTDDSGSVTITGLPACSIRGENYTYRGAELMPVRGDPSFWHQEQSLQTVRDAIVPAGNDYHDTYQVGWNQEEMTISNTLRSTSFQADKHWNGKSVGTVRLTLQYQDYRRAGSGDGWYSLRTVTLDGNADEKTGPCYEKAPWQAVWEDVPLVIAGTLFPGESKTRYRIVELIPRNAKFQLAEGSEEIQPLENLEGQTDQVSFTNVRKTLLVVEKTWGTRSERKPVSFMVYRTTDEAEIGRDLAENIVVCDGKTLHTLNFSGETASVKFENLPCYSPEGKLYHYYALETAIGEESTAESDVKISYTHGIPAYADGQKTRIVNVGQKELKLQKIWLDDGNINRPRALSLQLQRKNPAVSQNWEIVKDVNLNVDTSDPDTWKYSFGLLPESDDLGNLYTYRVIETSPGQIGNDYYHPTGTREAVYNSRTDCYEISLTNTLQGSVTIPVIKRWVDGSNAYGTRPQDISLHVFANGEEIHDFTLVKDKAGDEWRYEIQNLPKYDDQGRVISYRVTETQTTGYRSTLVQQTEIRQHSPGRLPDEQTPAIFKNTLQTQHKVKKIWGDEKPLDLHPGVTVQLLCTLSTGDQPQKVMMGDSPYTLTLDQTTNWRGTFENLPRFSEDGREYHYTADEIRIGSQDVTLGARKVQLAEGDAYQIIRYTENGETVISNVQEIQRKAQKIWKDHGDALHTRPTEVEMILQRSTGANIWVAVPVEPEQVEKDGDTWTYVYGNLPLTDANGRLYRYRVIEKIPQVLNGGNDYYQKQEVHDSNPGAEVISVITNTLTGEVEFKLTKQWLDGSDRQEKRPQSIVFDLLANGEKIREITVSKNGILPTNTWTYESGELDKYDREGRLIVYTVREQGVEGYQELIVTQTGTRPADEFGHMQDRQTDAVVSNTLLTDHRVKKIWGTQNTELPEITVQLMRRKGTDSREEAVQKNGAICTLTLNVRNQWTGTFENLLKFAEDGQEYRYFAKEIRIGDQSADEQTDYQIFSRTEGNLTTITNVDNIQKQAIKFWKDFGDAYSTRPDTLTVTLQRSLDGNVWTDVPQEDYQVSLDKQENTWYYSFSELAYADSTGTRYHYRMIETVPSVKNGGNDKYTAQQVHSTSADEQIISRITNTLTGKTGFQLTKQWVDGSNRDGKRPQSIVIDLLANGEKLREIPVSKNGILPKNTWTLQIEDLDKYDEDGKVIVYTIREQTAEGYSTELLSQTAAAAPDAWGHIPDAQTDAEIRNTLITEHSVKKIWGSLTPEGELPRVTVQLMRVKGSSGQEEPVLRDGEPWVLILNQENHWAGTFEKLLKFAEDGQEYRYSVREVKIGDQDAHRQTVYQIHTRTENSMTTISNVQNIQKQAVKIWKDHSNGYGTRPDELTVILQRSIEGEAFAPVPAEDYEVSFVKQEDLWTYTFRGLALTDNAGRRYEYRVVEQLPEALGEGKDSYAKQEVHTPDQETVSTITNTLQDLIDIPVKKIWVDNHGKLDRRPEQITLTLFADGEKTDQQLVLSGNLIEDLLGSNWKGSFRDLPEYDREGRRIVYTVEEDPAVSHYQVSYDQDGPTSQDGLTVTNTGEGRLRLRKEIVGKDKTRKFQFQVVLNTGTVDKQEKFPYQILDAAGETAATGRLSSGDILLLGHGEEAVIDDLPHETSYEVTELNPGHYMIEKYEAVGTIQAGYVTWVKFINTEKSTLIQTGQDWDLPGVFGLGGFVLILSGAAGLLIFRKKRRKA